MTGTCGRCTGRIDLTRTHVTLVRHVEQRDGTNITVRGSSEIAAFHATCAPTARDIRKVIELQSRVAGRTS